MDLQPLHPADYGSPLRLVANNPVNLIDALAAENAQRDVALHLKRLARQSNRQRFVRGFCIAVAVFCIVCFGGIELIGLVK